MKFSLKISVQQIFNIFFVSIFSFFYQRKFPLTVIEFTPTTSNIQVCFIAHIEQSVFDQLSFKIMQITNKGLGCRKNRKKRIVPFF